MKLLNLPLRPSTIAIFARRGFTTTEDVLISKQSGGIANLAAELGCTLSEAAKLSTEVDSAMKSTGGSNDNNGENASHVTAASLLLSVQKNNAAGGGKRNIVTFCKAIDMLLGGGFARAEVTEVAGVPGVGKTQISMQLCVDARLPKEYGGIEGEAVYIDSEGSFSPERCFKLAQVRSKVHETLFQH
jgi:RAD51-like protein 2